MAKGKRFRVTGKLRRTNQSSFNGTRALNQLNRTMKELGEPDLCGGYGYTNILGGLIDRTKEIEFMAHLTNPQEFYRELSRQGYVLVNPTIAQNVNTIKQNYQDELNRLYGHHLKAQIPTIREPTGEQTK